MMRNIGMVADGARTVRFAGYMKYADRKLSEGRPIRMMTAVLPAVWSDRAASSDVRKRNTNVCTLV